MKLAILVAKNCHVLLYVEKQERKNTTRFVVYDRSTDAFNAILVPRDQLVTGPNDTHKTMT